MGPGSSDLTSKSINQLIPCRTVARLEIDNDDLKDKLAASEQARAKSLQKPPKAAAPVKAEPLLGEGSRLGTPQVSHTAAEGQSMREAPGGDILGDGPLWEGDTAGTGSSAAHQPAAESQQEETLGSGGGSGQSNSKVPPAPANSST